MVLVTGAGAWQALAQSTSAKPAAPIATVGTRRIERDEFDARFQAADQQLTRQRGPQPAELRDVLRRQVLETMIRLQLLILEAPRAGVTASTAEAESALRSDPFFSPNGQFDANRWQLTRTTQAARFQAALEATRERLAAKKLDDQLQARFKPADAGLRARALRQLRRAYTEDISLRISDFDGSYPEPRETAVLAYYRANPEAFRRPDRATISVAFVNDPPRSQQEMEDATAGAAWTARMRHAADSVIAAVRAGATLEAASARFGGPRSGVQVLRDNFPGYWSGSEAQVTEVFRTRPGQLLSAPIPASEGFLVVRVDQVEPSHVAPLAEVARDIRARLREDARSHREERELRALYAELRDSLAGPAWTFRWAALDTATLRIPEPREADLERWYRGHLADFSSFDSRSGSIVAKSLAEVKDEVRVRWKRDKRVETARIDASELFEAWNAGRRASSVERSLRILESRPTPKDAPIDTGFAAAVLSDTIWARGEPKGAGLVPYGRGFLVWQVTSRVARHSPSFEQAQEALRIELQRRKDDAEEAGARALYAQDPHRFGSGRRIHFTRLVVNRPPLDDIRLTRAEVERWHRRNIEKYSAPELVRARHILISPINATPAADRAAHARADSLLARLRAGDDFDVMAAQYSDDPATKDKGGDLGVFQRGAMLQAFEDAAFAMEPGQLTGPVKTEVGYHLIKCTEHVEAYVQPLKLVYSIVASDLARVRADTVASQRADSLLRVLRGVPQFRAAGERMGLEQLHFVQAEDEPIEGTLLAPYFEELRRLKAGEVMPSKYIAKGEGWWITWVDSITPALEPTWLQARREALAAYQAGAGERAMMAKVAELDSLLASGWSFDSLGTLWGGLTRSKELVATGVRPNNTLPAAMDSLVFGTGDRGPALENGQLSGWVRWPGGVARVRLLERVEPAEAQVRERMEDLRRVAVERRLAGYFEDLKKRHTVRIQDRRLAAIPLPEPPSED